MIANNEFEDTSSSEDDPPLPQTVSRFILTSFVRAMIDKCSSSTERDQSRLLFVRKIMKRLVHESTSNYLSKDPSGDTTPGYRNRIHLRDIRIWQALACLSKGLRGVFFRDRHSHQNRHSPTHTQNRYVKGRLRIQKGDDTRDNENLASKTSSCGGEISCRDFRHTYSR